MYAAGAHHARATQAVLEHAVDSAVTALQVSPDGTLFWGTQAGDLCMGEVCVCVCLCVCVSVSECCKEMHRTAGYGVPNSV